MYQLGQNFFYLFSANYLIVNISCKSSFFQSCTMEPNFQGLLKSLSLFIAAVL